MVFARGTDEAPGVGKVGGAFVNSLREQTRKSVGAYGVNYPADKDFLAAADGANDASSHIQRMAVNCPNTKLVLGGYSQGPPSSTSSRPHRCPASGFAGRCRRRPPITSPPSLSSGIRPAGRET